MHPFFRGAARAYGSGAFGGVVTGVLMSLLSLIRLPSMYGVHYLSALNAHDLSLCALWGGLFGLLFATPWLVSQPLVRGVIVGLLVALLVLIVILPLIFHAGLFADRLGANAWAFIGIYCLCWGLAASLWHARST
ncbi:MAG: hypothetical protein ACOYKZ_01320 [Chlamydiia bacterium]